MLARAWGRIGGVWATLVMVLFLVSLRRGGWHLGADVSAGRCTNVWQQATTMSVLGIVAAQIGAAMAARTQHASLRAVGVVTNRLLPWGVAWEIVFAAALVSVPWLQPVFAAATPELWQVLFILPFPSWSGASTSCGAGTRGDAAGSTPSPWAARATLASMAPKTSPCKGEIITARACPARRRGWNSARWPSRVRVWSSGSTMSSSQGGGQLARHGIEVGHGRRTIAAATSAAARTRWSWTAPTRH